MFRAIGHAGRNPLMGVTRRTAAKKIIAAPRVSMSTSKGGFNPAAADQNITAQSIFHKTSIASLVLTPIALVAHPSPLSMPLDVILAITFPLHGKFETSSSIEAKMLKSTRILTQYPYPSMLRYLTHCRHPQHTLVCSGS